ncbi:hypothetical protein P280DRAFT_139703 [Massarina eburnea CBS 473.64]|uniref:Xylanolytic transcriptional activator regulatory domain-containing protein n=1 Tax=Massarina eburnea CBS 473.64 TaxID=1395130 RepID=A0A6A6RNN4_9PLEO|nr:hypothetical protein P280DRAFT_139703 [Massarina eburnea CBS 473.64]
MPRKRLKKSTPAMLAPKEKVSKGEELLNREMITTQLLDELWVIFQQHFLTDLSFLHPVNFPAQLKQVHSVPLEDSFACILLAFLALTTPFHDNFVQRIWPKYAGSSTPIAVSKRFADAARNRLNDTDAVDCPTLETTQSLLMLALHEWRCTQGKKCFVTVGKALSGAMMLGLFRQQDLDTRKYMPPREVNTATDKTPEELFIEAETRRRTFWSLYILDTYVSSGRDRNWRIKLEEIHVQLPCSEDSFTFGQPTRTRRLREDDRTFQARRDQYYESKQRENGHNRPWNNVVSKHEIEWEDAQEGLAWFIRALSVFREVSDWTCNVTRRNDDKVPWDPESDFAKLDAALEELKRNLPMSLTLDPKRTNGQIASRKYRPYVLLHSVFAICDMALHREYLPLLPCYESKPNGPIDGDISPALQKPPPSKKYPGRNWYEESAEKCFKAAREFFDLMCTCQESNTLVETPMAGFSLFYVLQIMLWCRFFPYMDQGKHICTDENNGPYPQLVRNFKRAWGLMTHMEPRMVMSNFWCTHLYKYWMVLKRGKKAYKAACGESPASNSSGSTENRPNGLDEWLPVEKDLKEFGDPQQDEHASKKVAEIDMPEVDEGSQMNSPRPVKSEDGDTPHGTPQGDDLPPPWISVNSHHAAKADETHPPKPTSSHSNSTHGGLPEYSYPTYAPLANGAHQTNASTQHGLSDSRPVYPSSHTYASQSLAVPVPTQEVWQQEYGSLGFPNNEYWQSFATGNEDAHQTMALQLPFVPPPWHGSENSNLYNSGNNYG